MDSKDSGVHVFNHQMLLHYRNPAIIKLHDDVLEKLVAEARPSVLCVDLMPVAGRKKKCSRKRKRGKWMGVRARLKNKPKRLLTGQ